MDIHMYRNIMLGGWMVVGGSRKGGACHGWERRREGGVGGWGFMTNTKEL